jgi:hypothetical protein
MRKDRTLFKATVTNKTRMAGSIFLQLARRLAGPVFYEYVFSLVTADAVPDTCCQHLGNLFSQSSSKFNRGKKYLALKIFMFSFNFKILCFVCGTLRG